MRSIHKLCVFCASSAGQNPAITRATDAFGRLLAAEGIGLVYGGSSTGLMGTLADAVLAGGGDVLGVIPEIIATERAHPGLTELVVAPDMHQRKAVMYERSDAFVALPGGFGTVDELAEITTWGQLGYHDKPVGLLNVDGYFDGLLAFFDRGVTDGLLRPDNRALLAHDTDAEQLLHRLRTDAFDHQPKWDS